MPSGIGFPPDGLVEGERRLLGSGTGKPQGVSSDSATVIIEHNRQPGLRGLALFIADNKGQERVIRLPNLIRRACLVTINQVKCLLVGLRSLMGERCELRINRLDNPFHRAVAWGNPVMLSTDASRFTVDGGDGSSWLL